MPGTILQAEKPEHALICFTYLILSSGAFGELDDRSFGSVDRLDDMDLDGGRSSKDSRYAPVLGDQRDKGRKAARALTGMRVRRYHSVVAFTEIALKLWLKGQRRRTNKGAGRTGLTPVRRLETPYWSRIVHHLSRARRNWGGRTAAIHL